MPIIRGDEISSKLISKIWKELFPNKPEPIILAFNVSDMEFFRLQNSAMEYDVQHGLDPLQGLEKEYGNRSPDGQPLAFVKRTEDGNFCIIRRKNSPNSEDSDLRHELEHIGRGEA